MAKDDALKAQRDQISKAVGEALAEWSLVEITLTFVFVSLMDRTKAPLVKGPVPWEMEEPDRRLAHVAFSAIKSFDARVDVVGGVVDEADIGDDLKSLWPGLAERLRKKHKSRHPIAHFMIENIEQDDGTWRAGLTPYPSSIGSVSNPRLGRAEVNQKAAAFSEIREGLAWYGAAVERLRGRLQGPLVPEPAVLLRVRQSLLNPKRLTPQPPRPPSQA